MADSTYSFDRSSVLLWLDGVDAVSEPTKPTRGKRKRPLQEMSANITPKRPRGTRGGKAVDRRRPMSDDEDDTEATPVPQPRRTRAGKAMDRGRPDDEDDNEATPVAQQVWHIQEPPTTVLRPSDSFSQGETAPSSPPRTASNSSLASVSTETSKSRRSKSPIKTIAMLRKGPHGVVPWEVNAIKNLPEAFQPIATAARQCHRGKHIVATQEKALLRVLAEDLDDTELDAAAAPSNVYGTSPPMALIKRIVEHTVKCQRGIRAEPAWNMLVHAPLLLEAWESSAFRSNVEVEPLTSVSIEPATLLRQTPKVSLHGRRVDLGVRLAVTDEMEDARAAVFESVNQTFYYNLLYAPLAFSIETKLQDGDGAEAAVQLTTWALAQATKMRQLLARAGKPNVPLPPLPLLVVKGADWEVMIMEEGTSSARMWRGLPLGSTATLLGAYKIVAFLHYLMAWAAGPYKKWWDDNIFHMVP